MLRTLLARTALAMRAMCTLPGKMALHVWTTLTTRVMCTRLGRAVLE